MVDRSYYTSGRFILDDLLKKVEHMVETARTDWQKTQRLESYAVSWPGDHVKGDDGSTITHAVIMRIPDSMNEKQKFEALQRMAVKTKAYGIALIEQHQDSLRVLFETKHGARVWVMPLERRGDRTVPGKARVRDNAECLGLLWRPNAGVS